MQVPVWPPPRTVLVFPAGLHLRGKAAVPSLVGKGVAWEDCVSPGQQQVRKGVGLLGVVVHWFHVCCSRAKVHLLASIPLVVVKSCHGTVSLMGGMPKKMMSCWLRCS